LFQKKYYLNNIDIILVHHKIQLPIFVIRQHIVKRNQHYKNTALP